MNTKAKQVNLAESYTEASRTKNMTYSLHPIAGGKIAVRFELNGDSVQFEEHAPDEKEAHDIGKHMQGRWLLVELNAEQAVWQKLDGEPKRLEIKFKQ